MRKSPSALFLAFSVLVSGCASHSTVNIANRRVSSAEIHEAVQLNQGRIRSMNGEGKFTIETPEIAQTASFWLNLQKPDSMMLKIEGPFGIEVGAAIVTREEFLFYNILQNKVFSGPTNAGNLSKILRVNLTFEDMIHLFSGGAFFQEDLSDGGNMSVEDDLFVLTYTGGQLSRRYWVDPSNLLIVKVQHLDSDGKLVFEQRFNQYWQVDGILLPHFVQLTQPKDRRRVSIAYSDLKVNIPPAQFTINIPDNAERIRLQ